MLIRDITFNDYFTGEEVTKKYYFNLNEAEMIEIEMSFGYNGLEASLQRLVDAKDTAKVMEEFKRIILMTIGERDGDSFLKNDEIRTRFEQSPAYSALIVEFFTVEGAMAKFVRDVLPKKLPGSENTPTPLLAPPAPMDVARVTSEQKAMGQAIIEGNANG